MIEKAPIAPGKRAGFYRRFRIEPGDGYVTTALEDEVHCMRVRLDHDGQKVTGGEAQMERWPWITCPGAEAVVIESFTGRSLDDAPPMGEKKLNCTHLFDLATLALAHARDTAPTCYDIFGSDPVDGVEHAEIRRNGEVLLTLAHKQHVVTEPAEIAGTMLFKLRGWIEALPPELIEAGRLLQWGAIVANGRQIPWEKQTDPSRMPPNCFTYQPGQRETTYRFGKVIDFAGSQEAEPLDHFDGKKFVERTSNPTLYKTPFGED